MSSPLKSLVMGIGVGIGVVILAASCSRELQETSATTDLPFVDETTERSAPATTFVHQDLIFDLSEEEEALVAFEAAWVCDVQNQTFDSNGAISNALADRLAESGIDEEAYGVFRQSINQNEDLRLAIMASYQRDCSR